MDAFPGLARSARHQLPIDREQFRDWQARRLAVRHAEWSGPNLFIRTYGPDGDEGAFLPILSLKEG